MNYKKLKDEGYYIYIEHGTFKANAITDSYSLIKDINESRYKIACFLNRKAANILKEKFNFFVKRAIKGTIWLNKPSHLEFTSNNEPLKLTFHDKII